MNISQLDIWLMIGWELHMKLHMKGADFVLSLDRALFQDPCCKARIQLLLLLKTTSSRMECESIRCWHPTNRRLMVKVNNSNQTDFCIVSESIWVAAWWTETQNGNADYHFAWHLCILASASRSIWSHYNATGYCTARNIAVSSMAGKVPGFGASLVANVLGNQ